MKKKTDNEIYNPAGNMRSTFDLLSFGVVNNKYLTIATTYCLFSQKVVNDNYLLITTFRGVNNEYLAFLVVNVDS